MHPFLHITENLVLPSYMLVLSLTYCLGLAFAFVRARRQNLDLHITLDIALVIMVAGFVGARLLHVFYESPEIYLAHPLEIFKFWNGGFVYYGGLIGAGVGVLLYTHFRKIDFWEWADFYAPILSLGYAIGRLACFLNGCCYGRLCELPWAVEFNHPGLPLGLRHPTAIYASLFEIIVFAVLIWLAKNRKHLFNSVKGGEIFLVWVMLHGCGRIIMETFRDDFRGPEPAGLSVSTLLSIGLVVSALIVLRIRHRKSA